MHHLAGALSVGELGAFEQLRKSAGASWQTMLGADDAADRSLVDDWLALLVTHRLQPALAGDFALVVHDFPASQCALARVVQREDVYVAERFECYLGGRELANGYHELNDAGEQQRRFEADIAKRRARGQIEVAIDRRLLASLSALPDCAGVALGIERLLQTMLDSDDLRATLAYAFADA
mgnify:CR=1 FL=1